MRNIFALKCFNFLHDLKSNLQMQKKPIIKIVGSWKYFDVPPHHWLSIKRRRRRNLWYNFIEVIKRISRRTPERREATWSEINYFLRIKFTFAFVGGSWLTLNFILRISASSTHTRVGSYCCCYSETCFLCFYCILMCDEISRARSRM